MAKKPKERSMTFIEMPLGDAKEQEVLPPAEYDLVIDDYKELDDGTIRYRLSVEGEPNARAIFHRINAIKPDDDAEKKNWKLLFNKAFLDKFDIPYRANGFEPSDGVGQRARCMLEQNVNPENNAVTNQIVLQV